MFNQINISKSLTMDDVLVFAEYLYMESVFLWPQLPWKLNLNNEVQTFKVDYCFELPVPDRPKLVHRPYLNW